VTATTWADRIQRRTQRNVAKAWTAPLFLVLSLTLAVSAVPFETGRTGRLVLAAVWLVVGLTVLLARRRHARRD
jgi:hypothetical protein